MPRGRPPGSKGSNSTTQTAVTIAALLAMQDGTHKTKKAAAEAAGTSPSALKPAQLARTATNPLFRRLLRSDPLDITAEHEGKRVSMREAMSKGAEKCVEVLARCSKKVGDMDKVEREAFAQADKWLKLCKELGLFREGEGPALPGDLAGHEGPEVGGEWWMQDTTRHEQPPGLLTVLPANGESSPECEPVTMDGNV